MTDELYINGVRMDMDDSGVFLDYSSGILSDLDDISANFSYTIKLPKTGCNMQEIGGLFFPKTWNDFPSAKNVASLYRDGIPIVLNATLNLLSVNEDEIEVTISWGVADVLGDISDNSIRDVYGNETFEFKEYLPTLALMSDMRKGKYNAPIENVADIMERIADSANYNLDYDASLFENWVVPMLYRVRAGLTNQWGYLTGFRVLYNETGDMPAINLWFQHIGGTGEMRTFGSGIIGEIGCVAGFYPNWDGEDAKSYKVNIYLRFEYDIEAAGGGEISPLILGRYHQDLDYVEPELEMLPIRDLSSPDKYIYIFEGQFTFSSDGAFTSTTPLCFKCESAYYMTFIEELNTYGIKVVDSSDEDDDLAEPSDMMRYSENLPDITCGDFVKGICGLFGLFPILVGEKVCLAKYSELMARAYGEYDWSDKLLQTSDVPNEMDINADGLAKVNRFIFENDDDVPETAGEVKVENNALEDSTTFLSVPFNGCENSTISGGVANIPLYSLESSDDDRGQKWDFDEDDNCYVLYNDGEYLRFYRFSYMLEQYYPNMDKLLAGKVITENFNLAANDLRNLDMRKVVYLAQYGAYFAIMEIKTKEKYSEVKLLTLQ